MHCLLGQNGAGKSTLIKVLAGAHRPDAGAIAWQRRAGHARQPAGRDAAGIATIYQELDLVDDLSVAENVFLGHEPRRCGFVRRSRGADGPRAGSSARLGHAEIPPGPRGRRAAGGRQADRQHGPRALPRRPADRHGRAERGARPRRGGQPVPDHPRADRARASPSSTSRTGWRRSARSATGSPCSRTAGPSRRTCRRATTPTRELVRLMTGRDIEYVFPPRRTVDADAATVLLEVDGLTWAGEFADVSLPVRAGEIVGIAGLVGSGRSEILETIYGARRPDRRHGQRRRPARCGRERAAPRSGRAGPGPRGAQEPGACCSASRSTATSRWPPSAASPAPGFLDRAAERREAATARRESLDVRPADVDRPVRTLSGGNQQKVVAGPLAAARQPAAAARRAHPRRRRRRPRRALPADPRAGRRAASPSCWSPARCPRCSAWPTGCW